MLQWRYLFQTTVGLSPSDQTKASHDQLRMGAISQTNDDDDDEVFQWTPHYHHLHASRVAAHAAQELSCDRTTVPDHADPHTFQRYTIYLQCCLVMPCVWKKTEGNSFL